MNYLRFSRRMLLVALVITAATCVHFATYACSYASPSIVQGPLGFDSWANHDVSVPQNVAVVAPSAFVGGDAGATITWTPVAGQRWSVPSAPIPEGTLLEFGSTVVVGNYLDTVPPSMPTIDFARIDSTRSRVLGCTRSTCGDHSWWTIRFMPATDDHADRDHITYAVYVGSSADEAATTATSVALQVEHSYELGDLGTFGTHVRYVAIAAVDQAGNVGPRSPSARVVQ